MTPFAVSAEDDTPTYRFGGVVELFPQEGGWHYVRVPLALTDQLGHLADRAVIAVHARMETVEWDTSLLPMGDGSHFIALKKRVREQIGIEEGDRVELFISPR